MRFARALDSASSRSSASTAVVVDDDAHDEECLPRLHIGVELQPGGPSSFQPPDAQLCLVAVDLPLPVKVPSGVGIRQEWGKAFESAGDPRVLLWRGVDLPRAGGGVSPTRSSDTLTCRWLHIDLCAPFLRLGSERRRQGRGGGPAAKSRCVPRAEGPLIGHLFESLITAGGYRSRLPATSPRIVMIVQAASGENGVPPRLVFRGAVRDSAGGGRAASGRGMILPAVICRIVVGSGPRTISLA